MRKKHKRRIVIKRKNSRFRVLILITLVSVIGFTVYIRNEEIKRKKNLYDANIIKLGLEADKTAGNYLRNTDLLCDILIHQLGKPYVYGKEGPDAFDCSGLVEYAYSRIGTKLPRTVDAQAKAGEAITRNNLRFGDIIFFTTDGISLTHAGIYVGRQYMIHAPKTGDVVKISNISSGYYLKNFIKAVRVLPDDSF